MINKRIGTKIRSVRESKGFSQELMADKLNISRSAYHRIENGETNSWINHIEALGRELDIKPEELFTGIDSVNQNEMENHSSAVLNNVYSDAHITINQLSDKVIELYEDKIKMLETEIVRLKKAEQ
ncbi:MAG: helix-turn-helix domain-containing protein [Paludibacter sp.]|jgi:transcriptional regulator with XRE-family HTH domain|nr:helix-turn-helix domain-containing protein [Paludibacter sp.]